MFYDIKRWIAYSDKEEELTDSEGRRIFQKLFQEMLPEYVVEKKEMIDERVAVLYNTISELIEDKKF